MKKVLCLGVIGCILLSGCGGSSKGDSSKAPVEQQKKTEFQVGETAEVDGIKITVNSADENPGNQYFKPKEGKTFIVLDVSLENTTDKEFASSSLMSYELKDGEGRKQDLSIFVDLNGSLDTTVPAGDKAAGQIAFETATEGALTLTFKPKLKDSVKIVIR